MKNDFDIHEWQAKYLSENTEARSRMDTVGFIEPEEIEATLSTIYHIVAGSRRDYLNIPDEVLKCLEQFAWRN